MLSCHFALGSVFRQGFVSLLLLCLLIHALNPFDFQAERLLNYWFSIVYKSTVSNSTFGNNASVLISF